MNQAQFTLAVDEVVEVKVKFTLKSKGVDKLFAFPVLATRLSQDEITAMLANKDQKIKEFLPEVVTGWAGQNLVIDAATGKPADFSPEALDAMLNAPGVASVVFNSYLKEVGAKEKN
jgi:hypothetical protein